jgi:hypothetical protein
LGKLTLRLQVAALFPVKYVEEKVRLGLCARWFRKAAEGDSFCHSPGIAGG